MKTIAEWQKEVHALAVEKGWWDGKARQIGEQVANMHAELSEAWEHYRNGHMVAFHDQMGKPDGFPIELADVVIRVMDTCEALGIDLEEMIALKHAYNTSRPHRHGGKLA